METDIPSPLLQKSEVESILRGHPRLTGFWKNANALILFRVLPTLQDPVYEIQLAWMWEDRLESFAWIWMDALQGELINYFPD